MPEQVDVLIIGGGAAGLMCGRVAGARGRRVLILDHAKKPAEKIRISGMVSRLVMVASRDRTCRCCLQRFRSVACVMMAGVAAVKSGTGHEAGCPSPPGDG